MKENAMRYAAALVSLGCALGWNAAAAGPATVRETTLEIPTYLVGPEDRNPPLWNLNVYPYPMQTDITRTKAPRKYRAVVLENDYIRVILFPDLGGRIYAAHDKTNGDFDFIYRNHVIKPGLVALRGAWLSGGIEWNFPTRGHTVHTFSPVQYKILEGDDGSVTCVVGTREWVRRMKWAVATTVYPDRSYFVNRVQLFNPTSMHNNGYFWANAAVHAWPDTKVVFPPADYTYAGRRRNPQPWPVYRGKHLGWYKNTPRAFDYFCGTPADFVAAYHHRRGCGSVHVASRHDSFGKKFWTWGVARSGLIWEDILTDDDGQYIELQSGRLLTQGDSWIFEPHLREGWDEYWYPVRDMEGLVQANADAALNFALRGGKLFTALNVTRTLRDATARLVSGEDEIFRETLSLAPGESWRKEVPFEGSAESCRFELRDAGGRDVLTYTPKHEEVPPPELEPAMPTGEAASVEELCLAGYYAMKHWNLPKAVELFERSLEKDPGFTPALRWLAVIRYKTGRFREALRLADRALRRNEDDHTARYYRALSRIALGDSQRVEEDLDLVGRRAAYRHVAPVVQASLAIGAGDLARAEERLRHALHENPGDLKARAVLASVLRHRGRTEEARELIDDVLADDPLNGLAEMERVLLGASEEEPPAVLRDDPQPYLEVACDYLQMNLDDDAAATLDRYAQGPETAAHPIVCFYRGYLADRAGHTEMAEKHYRRGVDLSPDYVFPFRTETLAVLDRGLRRLPHHWPLHYYLGTLLVAKLRWEEGLEHLRAARREEPDYAVAYRNLGEVYWRKLGDYAKARAEYEEALARAPDDPAYYLALDQLYALQDRHARRDALFHKAPPKIKADFRVLLGRAGYHTDVGEYDRALAILHENTFHPWEGWTGARKLYVRTLHLRADRFFEQGDYEKAIADLQAAMEWPENLGTGKPHRPDHSKEHYKLGLCYKALGKPETARQHFTAGVRQAGENSPWGAKAEKELE
jgi:tetratricopeptide (TPR) repeat protein